MKIGCITLSMSIAVAASVAACGGAWWFLDDLDMHKNPERVFRRHEAELRAYVARLQAGQVQPATGREPGEYGMPQFLIDRGATRATWRQGRVVIMFFVGPVEPVPQLEYSPGGFDPQEIQERSRGHHFQWVPLAPGWAACYWDS